jgi:hypothetical protein
MSPLIGMCPSTKVAANLTAEYHNVYKENAVILRQYSAGNGASRMNFPAGESFRSDRPRNDRVPGR